MLTTTEEKVIGNGKGCFENEETEHFRALGTTSKLDRVSQNISSLMCCVLGGAELSLLWKARENSRSKENSWKPGHGTEVVPVPPVGFQDGLGLALQS